MSYTRQQGHQTFPHTRGGEPNMGRKINLERLSDVLKIIQENDGQFRANDIAKQLDLHPQAIARVLPAFGEETEELICEDDRGFLKIFVV